MLNIISNMKAFLLVFILLASVIILPSSTTARELVSKEENSRHKHEDVNNNGIVTDATAGGPPITGGTGNPNKPSIGNCPRGKRYSTCLQPPKPPCKPYERNCH